MRAVNNNYLYSIISRVINDSLAAHQASRKTQTVFSVFPGATPAEIVSFIQSNPLLDAGVKDFMLMKGEDDNIIISEAWEITFIKNCMTWAESPAWRGGPDHYLLVKTLQVTYAACPVLKLPY